NAAFVRPADDGHARPKAMMTSNSALDIKTLTKDLRGGSRAALARAITLIESRRGDHQAAARDMVQALLPGTGKAIRVGITGSPGGVGAKTREAMLLCEAAGFDVVLVETVGIGQSETAVCDMTDFFLALMLPGAGDELQGIKKGLVELADMIAINKADGDNIERANLAAAEYRGALHILAPRSEHWHPP